MRKPHTKWTTLAGAATVSLAGFLACAAPAAAVATVAEQPSPPWSAIRPGSAIAYRIDGFDIGYLPSALQEDNYAISAQARTEQEGGRTAYVSWLLGGQTHARVAIMRSETLQDLDGLREEHFADLDQDSLRKVTEGGRTSYLSEGTGHMFWVDEPGVAVSVFLEPQMWDSAELARVGSSIRQSRFAGVQIPNNPILSGALPSSEGTAQDEPLARPATNKPEQGPASNPGIPVPPAAPPAGAPVPSEQEAPPSRPRPNAVTDQQIRQCLADKLSAPASSGEAQGEPAWDEALWLQAEAPARDAAITSCSDQLRVERWRVEEAVAPLEQEPAEEDNAEEAPRPGPGLTMPPFDSWNLLFWL
ncbi:hypothetical protein ACQEU5_14910 [Marinactinospora thermotolerans]|uniref:Uncharacterized protein n=1 Tax=Marinactinospora thermotolerans DSM 45154 TaxID=1122192 RepID=A0A1T4RNQ5_9ACTN|nr:hypothetical protein [Marinactinospora thermotolerans]SKA17507.1 hypothetical protein SAMN02745673_02835 [Marinactinospora thermotolerans DSM 45154]